MVNFERLTARGLRAYELGRLRFASRVALLVVPAATVCLLEPAGRSACGAFTLLLLLAAVGLRWRNRRGAASVETGLIAGGIPLVAGIVLSWCDVRCGLTGSEAYCTAMSVVLGLISGVTVSLRRARLGERSFSAVVAGGIAALAASLGCVRLGALGLAGIIVGIMVGTLVGSALRPRSKR
jgi:hypothetical protein